MPEQDTPPKREGNMYTFRIDNAQIDSLDALAHALGSDRSVVVRGCIRAGISHLVQGLTLTSNHNGLSTELRLSPTALRGRKIKHLREVYDDRQG